jgi:hypothetical protein
VSWRRDWPGLESVSIPDAMGLILTATAGLCLWIILWSLNVSGFDAILIAVVMVLIALGVRQLLPFLPGRRE